MQDRTTNKLVAGALSERLMRIAEHEENLGKLEHQIRKEFDASGKVKMFDQGPLFIEGEVVPVKGYGYKVHAIVKVHGTARIILTPHGPLQEDSDD